MVRKIALKRIEIEQLRDCLSSGKFHDGDIEVDVPWTLHDGRDRKGLRLLPQAEGYHQKILGRLSTEGIRPVYLDQIFPTGTYPPWMKEENQTDNWSKFFRSTGAARNRRQAEAKGTAKGTKKKRDKGDAGDGANAVLTEFIPQPLGEASVKESFASTAFGDFTVHTDMTFQHRDYQWSDVNNQYRLDSANGQPGSYSSQISGPGDSSSSFFPHQEFLLGYNSLSADPHYSIPFYGSASTASQGPLSLPSQADSYVLGIPPGQPEPFDLPFQQYDPTHHTRSQVQYEEKRGEGDDAELVGSYYGI